MVRITLILAQTSMSLTHAEKRKKPNLICHVQCLCSFDVWMMDKPIDKWSKHLIDKWPKHYLIDKWLKHWHLNCRLASGSGWLTHDWHLQRIVFQKFYNASFIGWLKSGFPGPATPLAADNWWAWFIIDSLSIICHSCVSHIIYYIFHQFSF